MRNVPLKGFLKKSPAAFVSGENESDVPRIENPNKVESIEKNEVNTGTAPNTGGIGLLIDSAKKVWEGYGKTNPDIIKGGRQTPGKI